QQHPDPHHLTELDHSIADWDLRVDEDRFRRRLNALVQWLHDRDDATPTPPQRSVDIHPPDEDGTACLQLHGPAPEILSLGRRRTPLSHRPHDPRDATPPPPPRSVAIHPPDEDGTACLQLHAPAPEILSLGRRLDSAARAIQKDQRKAIATGHDIPFDDGTATTTGKPLPLTRLRYEILTRSILDR